MDQWAVCCVCFRCDLPFFTGSWVKSVILVSYLLSHSTMQGSCWSVRWNMSSAWLGCMQACQELKIQQIELDSGTKMSEGKKPFKRNYQILLPAVRESSESVYGKWLELPSIIHCGCCMFWFQNAVEKPAGRGHAAHMHPRKSAHSWCEALWTPP